MRLVCPNCGAQYEVPPEAIPSAGRDVQCSACSRTWFERPPGAEVEPWDLVPRVLADEEEADDLAEAQVAPPPTPPAAPRSTVTSEVADILRAEAEREAQARAAEAEAASRIVPAASAVAVTDRPRPVSERPPVPPAEPPRPLPVAEPPPQPAPARAARPLDIDQINTSLRVANDRIGGKPPQVGKPVRRQGGFARGFWGAILVVALLAGLYVVTPTITAAVPEAGVVLDPYVAAVDGARVWLDRQVGALLGASAG